jgi:hypothetical protein
MSLIDIVFPFPFFFLSFGLGQALFYFSLILSSHLLLSSPLFIFSPSSYWAWLSLSLSLSLSIFFFFFRLFLRLVGLISPALLISPSSF